ncbi:MAG: hypothetical protein IJO56_06075 [Oscillospiraceae bacterium]|nr:hypothetical protein [Oscillospiraceae bacterium]
MSYVIRYTGKAPESVLRRRRNGIWIWMGISLVGIGAAKLLYPDLGYALQQFLFPGGGLQTLAMLEEAAMKLQQGSDFVQTIHGFCVDVIANAPS